MLTPRSSYPKSPVVTSSPESYAVCDANARPIKLLITEGL